MQVRRTLPGREIRTIGPWCFVDHYGPTGTPMDIGPHPHCGIQTVTWLMSGEVTHRDSAGHSQLVRPGELSLMTSGHGIAHSEYSAVPTGELFGVQLWVALPAAHRDRRAGYEHHDDLPGFADSRATGRVLLGEVAGVASPATAYSPVVGCAIDLARGAQVTLEIEPDLEYGVLVMAGDAVVSGVPVVHSELRYLGWGSRRLTLRTQQGARLLLLGGEPMMEPLLMWWNFVGRTHEEIVAAREEWTSGQRFGTVFDDRNPIVPAPPIPPAKLRARQSRP
jgi:quercetin 2,3-dioxygenase